MNTPRMQADERGLTINKSLAWTIVVALVMAGLWLGSTTTAMRTAVEAQSAIQTSHHFETIEYRRDAEGRLRTMEASHAINGTEISALRRDLSSFRQDMGELEALLRSIEGRFNGIPK